MTNSSKNKLRTAVCITTLALTALHVTNKITFSFATRKDRLNSGSGNYYKWRFGNIYYRKQGNGNPLLLIHDLQSDSSAYEWNRIVKELSAEHTVYTLDLIGCGRSDKPPFTYTNYLYVQLISDFIKQIIGHKTDIAVTGLSSSFALMACNACPEYFNRLLLINPVSPSSMNRIPAKRSRSLKLLMEAPLFGTFLYGLHMSYSRIRSCFHRTYFARRTKCSLRDIETYYEAAHLGGANARFLFASLKGRFVNINISNALKNINNSIILIQGDQLPKAEKISAEYTVLNPSIEKALILDSKHLPQLENPSALAEQIKLFLQ